MKCIQCGMDNTLRDRTANFGRCKNCKHSFTFEPTSMTGFKFTDQFFTNVINNISTKNTLFFTQKQFFYLLDRRLKTMTLRTGYAWLFTYLFFNIWAPGFIGGFLSLAIGSLSFIIVYFVLNIGFIITFFRASNSSTHNYQSRNTNARNLKIVGGMILIVGIFLSLVVLNSFSTFVISVSLGMLSIYLGTRQQIRQNGMAEAFLFNQNQFQDWVNRWTQVNGPLEKILPSPREERTPTEVSPDISAYSFDRLIVCDRAEIAQMLIANNFHFENNCAVLSITGYPQNIFSTVMQMVRRNPDLKVYALHDASPRGVRLINNLRTSPSWFQNSNVTIYDLGLLPRQLLKSRNAFVQASNYFAKQAKELPAAVRQDLTKEELEWLEAGKFVELESFSPRKLLQVVTQGIAKSRAPDSSDSLVAIEGDGSGGVYIFAADSFG